MAGPPAVFQGSTAYLSPSPGPIVTIGNFDGVHLGHQDLIAAARLRADEVGAPVCAYTFDPPPRDVFRPDNGVPTVQRLSDKIIALGRHGVDQVVIERFDRAFAAHEPEHFATQVLRDRLGARAVVVGWNFRFGRGRRGDVELLSRLLDVPVVGLSPVRWQGEAISSTRIRGAVAEGRVRDAARMLGRPHVVRGPVVRGDARGRTLGFPTANVAAETRLVPATGVYAVRVDVGDGSWRPAVANIGQRPTFGGQERRLEAHLLEFDGDLYDRELGVQFVARLREERSFSGRDALVAQIRVDAAEARKVLA